MAFPYTDELADYTPAFPGAVYSPHDFRNRTTDGVAVSAESFTVPAASPYTINLAQVPRRQAGLAVTVGGASRTLIRWGGVPSAGQVAADMATGLLQFHSSDAGLAASATYTGHGTPLMAHLFNQMGAEIGAVQTAAKASAAITAAAAVSALAALTPAADKFAYYTSSSAAALATITSFGRQLAALADASAGRTLLGLGTIATQAANNVSLTGGSITGMTAIGSSGAVSGASVSASGNVSAGGVFLQSGTLSDVRLRPTSNGYGTLFENYQGTAMARVDGSGNFLAGAGAAAAPSFAFYGDLDTGFYSMGADSIGLSIGGQALPCWSTRRALTSGAYDNETIHYQSSGYYGPWQRIYVSAGTVNPVNCRGGWMVVKGRGTATDTAGTGVTPIQTGDMIGSLMYRGASTANTWSQAVCADLHALAGYYGEAAGTALTAGTMRGHFYLSAGLAGGSKKILVGSAGTGAQGSWLCPEDTDLTICSAAGKLALFGGGPVARGAALTASNAAFSDTATSGGYGCSTSGNFDALVALVNNLRTRVVEIDARLNSTTGLSAWA